MKILNGTYVVGDIHGRFDEWIKMKNRIESEDPGAKFIFVGDIEDRGPKSYEMIKWAMENITESGKYQMIKGNHEDGKVQWWNGAKECARYDKLDLNDFCYIDGYWSEHYGFDHYMWENDVNSKNMDKIIQWMDSLPYYKDIVVNDQRFIIAHANMPKSVFDKKGNIKELTDNEKFFIIWNRNIDGFYGLENTILIHGHTPSTFEEAYPLDYKISEDDFGKIVKTHNRYNIDCGAGYMENMYGANLAILRLDDFKEYYLY